jgi:hypothetical protein
MLNAMSTTLPFSLHILVADGDPDGLRVVERSNWVAMAPTAGLATPQRGPLPPRSHHTTTT